MKLRIVLPWIAALAIMLVVWFIPLPGSVFGDEQLAAQRLPQTERAAADASLRFTDAQKKYKTFIGTHDMAAVHTEFKATMADIKATAGKPDPDKLLKLRDISTQISEYTGLLYNYALAGEQFFNMLDRYDNDLMGWTRSLGPKDIRYKERTYALADHRRLYPPPVGDLAPVPRWVYATEVAAQKASLDAHIAQLSPDPNPHSAAPQDVPSLLDADVDHIWSSGAAIEAIESHNDTYYYLLGRYQRQVQSLNAGGSENSSSDPVARGLSIAAGLLVLGGIAVMLTPFGNRKEQPLE
ncbi:MAG: hypothetical protein M3014_10260 [Chloroflexota bacterium]|nr:hypothetical protein [Chloroflexota bacterium]